MTAICRRSRFSILRRSTALDPAPPTPTSLIAMFLSVRSPCSRGSSLRFMADSGSGEQTFDPGEETARTAGGGGFFRLGAHPVIKQAEARVETRVAQILAHPRRR